MLLQFSVENFMSFRDKAVFNLVPGSGAEHACNVAASGQVRALKTAALFGANASGKSNLTRAVAAAILMVRESEAIQLGMPLFRVVPFKLDRTSPSLPTRFGFVFETGGVTYHYSFSATFERIVEERLQAYYSARPTTIFERNNDRYSFKSDRKTLESLARKNNPNRLFLATATAWNYERTKAPYLWFAKNIDAYTGNSWAMDFPAFVNDIDGEQKRFTTRLLEIADINISDYQVRNMDIPKEQTDGVTNAPFFRAAMGNSVEAHSSGGVSVVTTHNVKSGGAEAVFSLNLTEESAGTLQLFAMSTHMKRAFETGKTMVVDELEAGLHPLLLEAIVGLFHDPDINKQNAQLIFTAHAVSLLSLDVFRRDQIFFTEKDAGTATSELYSLDDFSIRKTENIRNGYLVGRYGALPVIREGASPWE